MGEVELESVKHKLALARLGVNDGDAGLSGEGRDGVAGRRGSAASGKSSVVLPDGTTVELTTPRL